MSATMTPAFEPHRFRSTQREAFERRLRAGLAELAPDGAFNEIVEMRALVARRGAGW